MSTFMVSKRHIDYLLTAGLELGRQWGSLRWLVPAPINPGSYERGNWCGPESMDEVRRRSRELTPETRDRVGIILTAENQASVDHRYDEREIEDLYEYERYSGRIDPVQVLKAISCYEYQSCEHPEWEASEAKAFCDALRHRAIGELPGYKDAEWDIRQTEEEIR